MTAREKKIVWAIAQGIIKAKDMTIEERQETVSQAFKGAMNGMEDYATVAMCMLLGVASTPDNEQSTD